MLPVSMRRGTRITPRCDEGRFFLRVRIGTIAGETRFTSPVEALVDTGARVSVVSPGLMDSFINQGVDPRPDDDGKAPVGSIESHGVRYGTKIYQVQVGVVLNHRRLLFLREFLSIHVPVTVLQKNGKTVSYRDEVGDGSPYVILGQDALRQLLARMSVRYRPEADSSRRANSETPSRIGCSLKVVGERRTIRS